MKRKKTWMEWIAVGAVLLLGGCQAVGDFADRVGEHMPVLGERCEHWQCFTESGQKQSELNKERMTQPAPHAAIASKPAAPRAALSAPPPAAPAPKRALAPFDMPDPALAPME